VLVQTDAHERLTLLTTASMVPRINWEQDPGLELIFNPVLGRIQILAESGLTSMMVLHDYVSKHITWLEHGDGSALGVEVLVLVMGKLSPDPSSHDFITPPTSCQPLCMDQAMRMLLLVAMPSMDDVGISPIQRGDQSCGVQIPGIDVTGGHGGAVPTPAPNKGKGKVVRVVHSDDEVSSDDDVSLQRRMRAPGRGTSMASAPPSPDGFCAAA
jgi:hypothetical protein